MREITVVMRGARTHTHTAAHFWYLTFRLIFQKIIIRVRGYNKTGPVCVCVGERGMLKQAQ